MTILYKVYITLIHKVVMVGTQDEARQDATPVYVCTATLRGALFVDIAMERMCVCVCVCLYLFVCVCACGVQGTAGGALSGSNVASLMPSERWINCVSVFVVLILSAGESLFMNEFWCSLITCTVKIYKLGLV